MSYLNRENRREMILNAAKELALSEGLIGMTVRKIANHAQVSVGQVHHHFDSLAQLKTEVFLQLMDRLNEVDKIAETDRWLDKLHILLCIEDIEEIRPYLRVYNEVVLLIQKDPSLKWAYMISTQRWHQAIVELIHQGHSHGEFTLKPGASLEDIAWRLIALFMGLERITDLELIGSSVANFKKHVSKLIDYELGIAGTGQIDIA